MCIRDRTYVDTSPIYDGRPTDSIKTVADQIKKEEIKEWIENIPCISIGEKTTKQLKKVGVKHILEAKDTTYLSMFDKIKESML